jgi:hypothetical protein
VRGQFIKLEDRKNWYLHNSEALVKLVKEPQTVSSTYKGMGEYVDKLEKAKLVTRINSAPYKRILKGVLSNGHLLVSIRSTEIVLTTFSDGGSSRIVLASDTPLDVIGFFAFDVGLVSKYLVGSVKIGVCRCAPDTHMLVIETRKGDKFALMGVAWRKYIADVREEKRQAYEICDRYGCK